MQLYLGIHEGKDIGALDAFEQSPNNEMGRRIDVTGDAAKMNRNRLDEMEVVCVFNSLFCLFILPKRQ